MRGIGTAGMSLIIVLAACGDDPIVPGVSSDELESFCDRRCEFQATCVPELRDIIAECKRQCRTSFDDPELFVQTCVEPDLRITGDPIGPYTVTSVVAHQECLIANGCEPIEPCEERRMLCIDLLPKEQRCQRASRRGYDGCSRAYNSCIEQGGSSQTCQQRIQSCYQTVSMTYQACRQ